jgi:hypothetical protein
VFFYQPLPNLSTLESEIQSSQAGHPEKPAKDI